MAGMDMMLNSLLGMFGMDAATVKKQIGDIGQTVLAFNGKLDTILANQRAIMSHLGIEQGADANGSTRENRNVGGTDEIGKA